MKKNWFKRHLHWTFLIGGGLIYNFGKTFTDVSERHGKDDLALVGALVAVGVLLLLYMWLLIQKGRSFWWLLLIIPFPVAYFFLKNNLEIPQSTKL